MSSPNFPVCACVLQDGLSLRHVGVLIDDRGGRRGGGSAALEGGGGGAGSGGGVGAVVGEGAFGVEGTGTTIAQVPARKDKPSTLIHVTC